MSNVYNIIQALVRTFFRTGGVSGKVPSLVFAEWSDLHVLGMLGLLQQLETLDGDVAKAAADFLREYLITGKKAIPVQLQDVFVDNENPVLECVYDTLYEIFVEGIYTPLDEEYLKHFKPFGNYLGPLDTQDVLTTAVVLNDGHFGWSGAVPKAHGVGKPSDNLTIWSKGGQLKSPKYGWGFEEKDSTMFLVERSSGMRIELGDEDVLKAYRKVEYPAILDLTRGQGLPQNYCELWCHLHKHAPDLVKKTSMVDLCVILDGLRSIVKDKYLSIPAKNSLFESLSEYPISFDTFLDQHLVPDHIASILEAMTDDTWQGPDECYRILDACGISRDRTKHDLTFQSQTIMSEVFRNLEVLRLNDVRQPDLDEVWVKTIVDSVVNVEKTIEAARKEEEDIVFKEPEELNLGAREPAPKKGRKAPVPIKQIDWWGDLEKEDSKKREDSLVEEQIHLAQRILEEEAKRDGRDPTALKSEDIIQLAKSKRVDLLEKAGKLQIGLQDMHVEYVNPFQLFPPPLNHYYREEWDNRYWRAEDLSRNLVLSLGGTKEDFSWSRALYNVFGYLPRPIVTFLCQIQSPETATKLTGIQVGELPKLSEKEITQRCGDALSAVMQEYGVKILRTCGGFQRTEMYAWLIAYKIKGVKSFDQRLEKAKTLIDNCSPERLEQIFVTFESLTASDIHCLRATADPKELEKFREVLKDVPEMGLTPAYFCPYEILEEEAKKAGLPAFAFPPPGALRTSHEMISWGDKYHSALDPAFLIWHNAAPYERKQSSFPKVAAIYRVLEHLPISMLKQMGWEKDFSLCNQPWFENPELLKPADIEAIVIKKIPRLVRTLGERALKDLEEGEERKEVLAWLCACDQVQPDDDFHTLRAIKESLKRTSVDLILSHFRDLDEKSKSELKDSLCRFPVEVLEFLEEHIAEFQKITPTWQKHTISILLSAAHGLTRGLIYGQSFVTGLFQDILTKNLQESTDQWFQSIRKEFSGTTIPNVYESLIISTHKSRLARLDTSLKKRTTEWKAFLEGKQKEMQSLDVGPMSKDSNEGTAPHNVVYDTVISHYKRYETMDAEKELETCPSHLRKEMLGWLVSGLYPESSPSNKEHEFSSRALCAFAITSSWTEESLEKAWQTKDINVERHDMTQWHRVMGRSGHITGNVAKALGLPENHVGMYCLNVLLWQFPPGVLIDLERMLPTLLEDKENPLKKVLYWLEQYRWGEKEITKLSTPTLYRQLKYYSHGSSSYDEIWTLTSYLSHIYSVEHGPLLLKLESLLGNYHPLVIEFIKENIEDILKKDKHIDYNLYVIELLANTFQTMLATKSAWSVIWLGDQFSILRLTSTFSSFWQGLSKENMSFSEVRLQTKEDPLWARVCCDLGMNETLLSWVTRAFVSKYPQQFSPKYIDELLRVLREYPPEVIGFIVHNIDKILNSEPSWFAVSVWDVETVASAVFNIIKSGPNENSHKQKLMEFKPALTEAVDTLCKSMIMDFSSIETPARSEMIRKLFDQDVAGTLAAIEQDPQSVPEETRQKLMEGAKKLARKRALDSFLKANEDDEEDEEDGEFDDEDDESHEDRLVKRAFEARRRKPPVMLKRGYEAIDNCRRKFERFAGLSDFEKKIFIQGLDYDGNHIYNHFRIVPYGLEPDEKKRFEELFEEAKALEQKYLEDLEKYEEDYEEPETMSTTETLKSIGSTVGEAVLEGGKQAAAYEFNEVLVDLIKKALISLGVKPEDLEGEPVSTVLQVISPVLLLALCQAFPDQIPAADKMEQASTLALRAISFEKIAPIIGSLMPDILKLKEKAALIDPSMALGEGVSPLTASFETSRVRSVQSS